MMLLNVERPTVHYKYIKLEAPTPAHKLGSWNKPISILHARWNALYLKALSLKSGRPSDRLEIARQIHLFILKKDSDNRDSAVFRVRTAHDNGILYRKSTYDSVLFP